MTELTDINMTSDLYDDKKYGLKIGVDNPEIAFYLPNAPLMPNFNSALYSGICLNLEHQVNVDIGADVDIEKVIELNGNHWRKIFTIMAKITVSDDKPESWRNHRNQVLSVNGSGLKTILHIKSEKLCSNAKIHIICGQQAFDDLSRIEPLAHLNDNQTVTVLGDKQKIMAHKQILIAPYLDYRQFPNQLISELRQYIKSFV
ncbi:MULTISPECIES: DUF6942 family protein [Shewanella]|uniref:DUF6942 family protein n=1 Tax=Shewanella TaxID=22 RepID=UPI001BBC5CC3|nr:MULTISPECIES: hypothetical protein [Shewanella]GIU53606.1 hypothetical protein TUM4249_32470 [Shewanella sp. KT0246]